MFSPGGTFHYGESQSTRHLHIILCENVPGISVLAVSVNTVRDWTDKTLEIQPHEHPYIRVPSAVSYNRVDNFPLTLLQARYEQSQQLAQGFRNFDVDMPVSAELLQRIQEGALASPLTPRRMKAIIRAKCEGLSSTNSDSLLS